MYEPQEDDPFLDLGFLKLSLEQVVLVAMAACIAMIVYDIFFS